jgi:hypothetical protein
MKLPAMLLKAAWPSAGAGDLFILQKSFLKAKEDKERAC